jgi:predicted HTH domain antitoxin
VNQLVIDLPEEALAALGLSPEEATREACRILAIHWYDQGRVSQGTGARIAGLSRQDFLAALAAAQVPVVQVTAEELREDVGRGLATDRQR